MNARRLRPPSREARRSGFSLIEIMLVTAIMGMLLLVATPSLIRTFRGARLNASARTVIMAHRQARALAALRQEQMALVLDTVNQRVELVGMRGTPSTNTETVAEGEPVQDSSVETEWERWLADRIHFVECHVSREEQAQDGIYWIRYYPGGVSDGFEVTLADEQGRAVRLVADPITGRIEVVHEE